LAVAQAASVAFLVAATARARSPRLLMGARARAPCLLVAGISTRTRVAGISIVVASTSNPGAMAAGAPGRVSSGSNRANAMTGLVAPAAGAPGERGLSPSGGMVAGRTEPEPTSMPSMVPRRPCGKERLDGRKSVMASLPSRTGALEVEGAALRAHHPAAQSRGGNPGRMGKRG
jgi:hypothetical protein